MEEQKYHSEIAQLIQHRLSDFFDKTYTNYHPSNKIVQQADIDQH